MLSRVDFPLPEVPMIATNSPCSMEISIPFKAFTIFGSFPYCFIRFAVLKILMSDFLTSFLNICSFSIAKSGNPAI